MALLPPPQRARGESEDGGGGAARSVRVPDMAGRQATAHTDLGSTWTDLAFSLPRAASQAPALGLCLGSREGSPLPDPCPGPFGLEETTRLAPPSWRAWPYHLRFSLAVTQVPREGLSCTWAPLALEPAALGTEGAAGTVSSTPVRTRTPCQAEGGGEGWEDAGLHCPSTQAVCTDGVRLPPRTS